MRQIIALAIALLGISSTAFAGDRFCPHPSDKEVPFNAVEIIPFGYALLFANGAMYCKRHHEYKDLFECDGDLSTGLDFIMSKDKTKLVVTFHDMEPAALTLCGSDNAEKG